MLVELSSVRIRFGGGGTTVTEPAGAWASDKGAAITGVAVSRPQAPSAAQSLRTWNFFMSHLTIQMHQLLLTFLPTTIFWTTDFVLRVPSTRAVMR